MYWLNVSYLRRDGIRCLGKWNRRDIVIVFHPFLRTLRIGNFQPAIVGAGLPHRKEAVAIRRRHLIDEIPGAIGKLGGQANRVGNLPKLARLIVFEIRGGDQRGRLLLLLSAGPRRVRSRGSHLSNGIYDRNQSE